MSTLDEIVVKRYRHDGFFRKYDVTQTISLELSLRFMLTLSISLVYR